MELLQRGEMCWILSEALKRVLTGLQRPDAGRGGHNKNHQRRDETSDSVPGRPFWSSAVGKAGGDSCGRSSSKRHNM